jgi:hypothetical protein
MQPSSLELIVLDNVDSMAVTEPQFHRLETRVTAIETAVARIEGASSAAATAATAKSSNPAVIALLSLVGAAFFAYQAWLGIELVHQGKQISAILVKLNPAQSLDDISRLDQSEFSKSLQALQKAMQQPLSSTPQPTLRRVAEKLLASDESSPDYWPAVLHFIQAASSGLTSDVPAPGTPNLILRQNKIKDIGNEVAKPLSHIIVELDGGDVVNQRFENSRIIFTENPVHMRNVAFVNCVFEMPVSVAPSQFLRDVSKSLLASNLKSASIAQL